MIGKDMSYRPGMDQVLASRAAGSSGKGSIDGIPRMFVWTDSTPPAGGAGRPVLAEHPRRCGARRRSGSARILLALAVFVAAVTVFLIREIDRRARAERRLEELSITDPLTGLTNRRKFDAAIDERMASRAAAAARRSRC